LTPVASTLPRRAPRFRFSPVPAARAVVPSPCPTAPPIPTPPRAPPSSPSSPISAYVDEYLRSTDTTAGQTHLGGRGLRGCAGGMGPETAALHSRSREAKRTPPVQGAATTMGSRTNLRLVRTLSLAQPRLRTASQNRRDHGLFGHDSSHGQAPRQAIIEFSNTLLRSYRVARYGYSEIELLNCLVHHSLNPWPNPRINLANSVGKTAPPARHWLRRSRTRRRPR